MLFIKTGCDLKKEKGCIKCSACQDIENENAFCMIQGWETQKDLDSYLRSDLFEVLLGTKKFLSKPWEINFNTVSSTTEFEAVKKERGKISSVLYE
jgi:quinol monooxygenase YgiN